MRSRTMTRSPISSERRVRLAALAGAALNTLGRTVPGIVGPLVLVAGLWMLAPWLGVTALGAILWTLDRRVP